MTYKETLDYLYNALPAYQTQGKSAYKENLDNTNALMTAMNNPHKGFKSIHVAGTNGKGSVSHILAAIFQKCGYKTGLYTSPHLLDFRERIRIDGAVISKEEVIQFTEDNKATFEDIKPSFFEMTVSMAFHTFAKEEVDIAIIETGLGGRLDSTNIITPEAAVITNISMDHADILGDTLEKIAAEKAGIIKPGVPTILGDMSKELIPLFKKRAQEENSTLTVTNDEYKIVSHKREGKNHRVTFNKSGKYFALDTDILGNYQANNIATALATLDALEGSTDFKFGKEPIKYALLNIRRLTGLRGRWDTIQKKPLWICDTGHNESGIEFVMKQVSQLPQKRKFVIYGCTNDKDVERLIPLFDRECHYIFTKAENKRSLDEKKLLEKGKKARLICQDAESVEKAIAIARKSATENDVVILCGSTFLVADALTVF